MDEALDLLPESLTETYERILSTIEGRENVKRLRTLLCWLLHARRPLRIKELRETVGINVNEEPYFDPRKRLNQRPKILDHCTFLIVADQDSDVDDMFAVDVDNFQPSSGPTWQDTSVLRLAHSSVVQFLEQDEKLSDHSRQFSATKSEGHSLIAQSCLAYILHLDSSTAPPDAADSCPLFDYAIHYWYYHVQQSGIHNEKLASLIEKVLRTSWEIYRLVTYPNISTRYNPWGGTNASTSGPGKGMEQNDRLCTNCHKISLEGLRKQNGVVHKTYAALMASAQKCRLCEMIRSALLQFGIARYCQISSETALSLKVSENISRELDVEIPRVTGNSEITLRMESHDPFLLISCYCYFGRLHIYTNPGTYLRKERITRNHDYLYCGLLVFVLTTRPQTPLRLPVSSEDQYTQILNHFSLICDTGFKNVARITQNAKRICLQAVSLRD